MKQVTEYFEKYREASRHLRNVYYFPQGDAAWDVLEDFDELNLLLFKHLVCAPLNIEYKKYNWFKEPATCFTLKPLGTRLPIMINRMPNTNHGYWDHEIKSVKPSDLNLKFMSYFDWNPQGVMDSRYIMCHVSSASESTQIVGHVALVESHYVEVYYEESS